MQDKRFRKHNHLRTSSEFTNVFRKGEKLVTGVLVFHYLRTDLGVTRLGLAVSRKVGKAVIRNLVKRRIREAFREKLDAFTEPYDIVVYPRRGVLDKHLTDYLKSFEILAYRAGKPKKKYPPRNA